MIGKISSEHGLIELRQLKGHHGSWAITTTEECIDLDLSGINYKTYSGEEPIKWLNILKDHGKVLFPVTFQNQDDLPKEVEGAAEYVIVPHSDGGGNGPYLTPILAVRTFDGHIYADVLSLCL